MGSTTRTAIFDGHPYQVSVAGFLGHDQAVMVHAERVMDDSGAANYDDLPRAVWPSPAFGYRGYCAEITPPMVEQEHDLQWLRRNGWNPRGTLALRQYLRTTSDHNREVVLSLIVRVSDCSDQVAQEQAFAALQSKLSVR